MRALENPCQDMVGNFCILPFGFGKDWIMMDYEEIKEDGEEKEASGGFAKGVITGIFGTVLALAAVIAIVTIVFGNLIIIQPKGELSGGKKTVLSDDVLHKVNELIGYIHLYFYDDVEEEQLAEGIYSGLLEGLDDEYTEYYTAAEYENLQISATQNY